MFTRIPYRPSSRAMGSIMPTTAPFDALYAACPTCPSNAATLNVQRGNTYGHAEYACILEQCCYSDIDGNRNNEKRSVRDLGAHLAVLMMTPLSEASSGGRADMASAASRITLNVPTVFTFNTCNRSMRENSPVRVLTLERESGCRPRANRRERVQLRTHALKVRERVNTLLPKNLSGCCDASALYHHVHPSPLCDHVLDHLPNLQECIAVVVVFYF